MTCDERLTFLLTMLKRCGQYNIGLLFTLLVVYQVKHFLADFIFQTSYHLGKFKDKGWVAPLAAHAGVHAAFTFFIALVVSHPYFAVGMACFDFAVHFTMDRIKASPKLMGRWKALSASEWLYYSGRTERNNVIGYEQQDEALDRLRGNRLFWLSIGIDQSAHHLTHYLIIYLLLTHTH